MQLELLDMVLVPSPRPDWVPTDIFELVSIKDTLSIRICWLCGILNRLRDVLVDLLLFP